MRISKFLAFSFHNTIALVAFTGITGTAFALQNPAITTPPAQVTATANPATSASVAAAKPTTDASTKPVIAKTAAQIAPTVTSKTNWADLSAEQKIALAPLSKEWDKMDDLRKKKWLGIANKYANMKPEEQQRVQERIDAWGKMTPEQRMAVRENFASTAKKSPEQKSAQWQQYQQLSDEEKVKLANQAKTKKTITTIQPESKRTSPILAPLKKGPPAANPASSAASQASIK